MKLKKALASLIEWERVCRRRYAGLRTAGEVEALLGATGWDLDDVAQIAWADHERAADPGPGAKDVDTFNERLLESVNATGEIFISHTRLDGRYTLRLAIGNLHTTQAHVERAWTLIHEHASRLCAAL